MDILNDPPSRLDIEQQKNMLMQDQLVASRRLWRWRFIGAGVGVLWLPLLLLSNTYIELPLLTLSLVLVMLVIMIVCWLHDLRLRDALRASMTALSELNDLDVRRHRLQWHRLKEMGEFYAPVGAYLEKLRSQDRNPTLAEFNLIVNWVSQRNQLFQHPVISTDQPSVVEKQSSTESL